MMLVNERVSAVKFHQVYIYNILIIQNFLYAFYATTKSVFHVKKYFQMILLHTKLWKQTLQNEA
jgi:hypothetical protein